MNGHCEGFEKDSGTSKILSVEEAYPLSGLSRNTFYAGVNNGEIPSIRVGKRILIPSSAFEAWLDGNWQPNNTA